MADDLGYECLTPNGGTSYSTPRLERMASEGMRFTHFYSQPQCTPSRVKIMTGKYNWRNHKRWAYLEPGQYTFAHFMRAAGYATGLAGKWQLWAPERGVDAPKGMKPDEAGFDEYMYWAYAIEMSPEDKRLYDEVRLEAFGHPASRKTSRYWHPALLKNGQYVHTSADDYGPHLISEFALEFMETHKDEPFFLYYPMLLPHSPFVATPHSRQINATTKFAVSPANFAESVAYTDYLVGRLLDHLDVLGLAGNTLVLFLGDNGTHLRVTSVLADREIAGGKSFASEAGTHVPLLARWPGHAPARSVSADLIELSDFLPTLSDLVGSPLPQDEVFDGRSFLPQLRGEEGNPRESLFVHWDANPTNSVPPLRFARSKRFKLYHTGLFYDMRSDWEERNPISTRNLPAQIAPIYDRLQSVLDSMPWTND